MKKIQKTMLLGIMFILLPVELNELTYIQETSGDASYIELTPVQLKSYRHSCSKQYMNDTYPNSFGMPIPNIYDMVLVIFEDYPTDIEIVNASISLTLNHTTRILSMTIWWEEHYNQFMNLSEIDEYADANFTNNYQLFRNQDPFDMLGHEEYILSHDSTSQLINASLNRGERFLYSVIIADGEPSGIESLSLQLNYREV